MIPSSELCESGLSFFVPADSTVLAPSLFVLKPLEPDGPPLTLAHQSPEVCLATDFRPRDGEMIVNTVKDSYNLNTSSAVLSKKKKTYFYAAFFDDTINSCELHGSSTKNQIDAPCLNVNQTNEPQKVERCTDESCSNFYPENAKLNFFLLVMNGVRVVFTKTLVFNTILTIRALVF
ncbi:uncharacterized protein trdc isoform X1 [Brachyistius frenatus]|uniref:uncharacterized protein trdc isoform X1 n=2 Tax=Brachyistius frenatus TaxID=100188 RepID=UPI0037E901FC